MFFNKFKAGITRLSTTFMQESAPCVLASPLDAVKFAVQSLNQRWKAVQAYSKAAQENQKAFVAAMNHFGIDGLKGIDDQEIMRRCRRRMLTHGNPE